MLPFLIPFLSPLVEKLVGLIPDPAAREKARLEAEQQLIAQQDDMVKAFLASDQAQAAINLAETNVTGNDWFKFFCAGWRPALAWVCVSSYFWAYVAQPLILFWASFFHYGVSVPPIDNVSMEKVLFGILGLTGARMYEKIQGAQNNH